MRTITRLVKSRTVSLLLLAASLTLGGSAYAYGQDSFPIVPPAGNLAANGGAESESTGEIRYANNRNQKETKKNEPEPEKKKSEAPPESGDDIESHLKETEVREDEDPDEEKPSPDGETSANENATREEEHESGDNVGGKLKESRKFQKGLFKRTPLAKLDRLVKPTRDRLSDTIGIDVGLAYTALFQAATDGDKPREAASGDFDFFGRWTLLNRGKPNTGAVGFLAENRHRYSKITPNALNDNLGGLWRTTKSFNTLDFSLVQLWWEQYLFDDHLKVVAGKIDASNYYNGNRFQSQNTSFLNQAFSSNPTRSFPDNGLGVSVRVAPSDDIYFSFGAHDTNNSKTTMGFNDLDEDELFYAVEIGLTPQFERWGSGRYRFTGWHTGPGKRTSGQSGSGFALSFEHDLGNDFVPFFRYGYQGDELEATKQIVVGGLGVLNPLGSKDDIFGIGFAWGEPVDSASRDQYVMELFYRHQFTPKVQLTPGFQVIIDPSLNPDDDVIGIFEFRVRIVF